VSHGFVGGRVAVVAADGFCDVVGVVTDGDVRHMSAPRSVLEGAVQLLLSLRGLFAARKGKSASRLRRWSGHASVAVSSKGLIAVSGGRVTVARRWKG
jgi:hypothetical protein